MEKDNLEFLCNCEVMLVDRNPEGMLPDFRSSVNREDFLRLIPNIVQKIPHRLPIFSSIAVIRESEETYFSCVVSTRFKG
jgi:hypothetical protein